MTTLVITGANRGIGLALVKAYAKPGNRIFAWCREPDRADELQTLAALSDSSIQVVQADVADDASVHSAAAFLGDTPVDVLLNVAGLIREEKGPEDRNFDGWRESFEVMTIGPFRVTQALLPNLERAKGKVMTVTSQIGASTWESGGLYSYGAAKAAVNRVMKSLAVDLKGRGITVALVHPGHVSTDMGGPTAPVTPTESAEGIQRVVEGLTPASTGSFFKWNAEIHPW